ncbi:hypothetical protein RJ640_025043 [Escallonia rubra]|uniref:Sodium/calcium exchanger membrane region domain-containing protein n=1 Tax=Escallonia rubra TaxID=112253 RepID=A0AA88UTK1_9ASTE|nr:hypothetical protein RJ640_025043 [Escallonia rubra]
MAFPFTPNPLKATAIALTLLSTLLFFLFTTFSSPPHHHPSTTPLTHHRSLLPATTPCSPLHHISSPDVGLIDYSSLHHCTFRSNPRFSLPFLSLTLLLLFYILVAAAQRHFSPVVTTLSAHLRLSPSMGAVTLLALGNGAPDVFASVAAVGGGQARTGFGAILSAGTFVSAFVVGFVAIYAAPFSVDPAPFVRDVFFYLVAALFLFTVYLGAEIYLWQAVGFVGFYLFFVGFVFWMDLGTGNVNRNGGGGEVGLGHVGHVEMRTELVEAYCESEEKIEGGKLEGGNPGFGIWRAFQKMSTLPARIYNYIGSHSIVVGSDIAHGGFSRYQEIDIYVKVLYDRGREGSKKLISKTWELPVSLLLKLTIPQASPSEWSRFFRSANIALCPLALLYSCKSFMPLNYSIVFLLPDTHFPLWLVVFLGSSSLAVLHFAVGKEVPKTEQIAIVVAAFVMSVFWISTMAGELLNCLAALGELLELSPALLGLTVLAWGNSVGDLVADVAVAKAGQPAMAMAGCFACPMFNMLFGLGTALVIQTANVYPEAYKLHFHVSIAVAFIFLFLSLMGSLLVVTWCRFRVPRFWGFCLVALYVVFIVVSLVIAKFSA